MSISQHAEALSSENFAFVGDLLRKEAAIVLEAGKEYLVETRLSSVAVRNGFGSVNAMVEGMKSTPNQAICTQAVDALTTNETLFFRDANPFEALREHIIPKFKAENPGAVLKFWSAACSTGQEPYSIAMLMAEHFPEIETKITATDLSPSVISRAREGVFSQIEVNRGLPAKLLVKYFSQTPAGWRISDGLRQRIDFREMNLIRPWQLLPKAHVVFIRNVMIYFDVEVRREILQRVKEVIAPGGYLGLGGAETTVTIDPAFKPVVLGRSTFYQL